MYLAPSKQGRLSGQRTNAMPDDDDEDEDEDYDAADDDCNVIEFLGVVTQSSGMLCHVLYCNVS